MAFSLEAFYQRNRRALTWIIFFLLLWLLRDFFGLIFLTFVFAFIATQMVQTGQRHLNLTRRPAIIIVYLLFLSFIGCFGGFVVPEVVAEAKNLLANLDQIEGRVIEVKNNMVARYPVLGHALTSYLKEVEESTTAPESPAGTDASRKETEVRRSRPVTRIVGESEEKGPHIRFEFEMTLPAAKETVTSPTAANVATAKQKVAPARPKPSSEDETLMRLFVVNVRQYAPKVLNALGRGSFTMLVALLLSFLITMDITRLSKEFESLRLSRLHDFYEQTAQPVIRFGWVVGRAIEAQAVIACANTLLTLLGLLILGVPSLFALSLIVFLCSFIPVLGVFISTTPIVLVALNAGGMFKAFTAIGLVVVVHMVEAYVLNPLIYGHHLKLNPVLVLIILFVGHHLFGLWGMLLGVPVAYYFIHDVFGVPLWINEPRQKAVGESSAGEGKGE